MNIFISIIIFTRQSEKKSIFADFLSMMSVSIYKDFAKYVSLNVLGMLCLSCYIIVDTLLISKALGSYGLAALNYCIAVISVVYGLGLLLGIGGAIQYAIFQNKNEAHKANVVFMHSLLVAAAISLIFIFLGVFFSIQMSKILGADADTLNLTNIYLKTILLSSPLFLFNGILIAFVRNDENPSLAMVAMVAGSISNIVFDYIFLFPLAMGMFGAAFATALSLVVSISILLLHFYRKSTKLYFLKTKIYFHKIHNIIVLGMSAFVGELSFAIALITFNLTILKIEGSIGVAAYSVVANIALFAICIFTGIAQGIQPLLARGYAQGDNIFVKKIITCATALVILLSVVVYIVIYCYSDNIVSEFNNQKNVRLGELATEGLVIYFTGFMFAGINILAAAYFSVVGNAKFGITIAVLRSCVIMVPMVIILSNFFGMTGLWLSFLITEFLVCLLIVIVSKRRQKYSALPNL